MHHAAGAPPREYRPPKGGRVIPMIWEVSSCRADDVPIGLGIDANPLFPARLIAPICCYPLRLSCLSIQSACQCLAPYMPKAMRSFCCAKIGERRHGLGWLGRMALPPLLLNEQPVHTDEILTSQAFGRLVDRLRQRHDHVIIRPSPPSLMRARPYRLSIHWSSWLSGEARKSMPFSFTRWPSRNRVIAFLACS